jgi:penicillin-insensitive murein DD-endopeptidase
LAKLSAATTIMSARYSPTACGASWPAVSRALRVACAALLLAALAGPAPAFARERTNAELPAAYRRSPFAMMSLSVGSPTNGWQIRAKKLKASENLWIQNKSVPYSYGHPALVLMLYRTAKQMAHQTPGSVLLVGDLSREFGGPLAGHRSHQSGRDADVGFFVTDEKGRPLNSQKLRTFDSQGRARDGSGLRFDDYRNWLLVQLWLKDNRADLEYVFVASHLRRRLLEFAQKRPAFRKYVADAAQFLRQPSNGLPHDDHFHVRIACPDKQRGLCEPIIVNRRSASR